MKLMVMDGQGGGIGATIIKGLRASVGNDLEILALGTNSIATSRMMKAGANKGASGENAIGQTASRLDVITGGLAILQPHSMLGEMTPAMVESIVRSRARKIVMPLKSENIELVGLRDEPIPHLIEELVQRVAATIRESNDV